MCTNEQAVQFSSVRCVEFRNTILMSIANFGEGRKTHVKDELFSSLKNRMQKKCKNLNRRALVVNPDTDT